TSSRRPARCAARRRHSRPSGCAAQVADVCRSQPCGGPSAGRPRPRHDGAGILTENPRLDTQEHPVGRVVVDVMPKPEILDPQGKAVANALPRLGFTQFSSVRQGKRFELEVDGPVTEEILAAAREAGEHVLSNPVIEDVVAVYEEQD